MLKSNAVIWRGKGQIYCETKAIWRAKGQICKQRKLQADVTNSFTFYEAVQ